jgi:ribokinase
MSSNSIIVIGSANTDMVVKTDILPLPGETKLGGRFFMNAGGKGANQAVAAARLGGNVIFVSKIGDDIFGKQTLDNLRKENITTDYVFVDDVEPSGTALIMVNQEGENCIVVAPGANANLLPADIENVKIIATAEIILMQLEIPMETIAAVVKIANSNNQKVIINPAPAQPLEIELLQGLFLITPNETEASLLTGINVVDDESASQAADAFMDKGVQNIVITMGKQGAYFQNNSLKLKINAPTVKAIDTTAAGDTFNGAIAVALNEGLDWETAIKLAVEAASISVTRMGAQASVPYRNELVLK